MKDRLIAILEEKKLSVSQFADAAGIQRATFHHIISGRNNPSLDILIKIHNAYPDIDLNWLLTGEYDMKSGLKGAVQQELFPSEISKIKPDDGDQTEYDSHEEVDSAAISTQKPIESISYDKKITKIIVVYSDGSTEFFQ